MQYFNYDKNVSFTWCRCGTARGGLTVFVNTAKLHGNYVCVCDAKTLLINLGEHQHFIVLVYSPPGSTIDDWLCLTNSLTSVRLNAKSSLWSILDDFNLLEVQYEFSFRPCMSDMFRKMFNFFRI